MILSIIIVNWNATTLLEGCLQSIRESGASGFEFEILVIDNASGDGGARRIRELNLGISVIENPENLGFAAACNQGIGASSGLHLLFLNPDTEVRPGALDLLVSFMKNCPAAGMAGPMVLNPDGSLQKSVFREPSLGSEFLRLFHLDRLKSSNTGPSRDKQRPIEVEILGGACLIVRRKAIVEVGGFDQDFFMYNEEYDLCRRVRCAGWTLHWVPNARIVHLGGQSTRLEPERMFLELHRSKILYFRKHHGKAQAQCYKLLLLLAALSRQLAPLAPRSRQRRSGAIRASQYRSLIQKLPLY